MGKLIWTGIEAHMDLWKSFGGETNDLEERGARREKAWERFLLLLIYLLLSLLTSLCVILMQFKARKLLQKPAESMD